MAVPKQQAGHRESPTTVPKINSTKRPIGSKPKHDANIHYGASNAKNELPQTRSEAMGINITEQSILYERATAKQAILTC